MIPNHFHDELQKSGENSSVGVVSGNKNLKNLNKYKCSICRPNVLIILL